MASSQPPPRAKPRTAATTGVRTAAIRSQTAKRSSTRRVTGVWRASSRMSAPAANARSPDPVTTIARQDRSASRTASASASSSSRSKLRALRTSGRSSVTRATPSTGPSELAAGNWTLTRWRSASWSVAVGAVWVNAVLRVALTVAAARNRGTAVGRARRSFRPVVILEDQERRETRRDLPEVAPSASFTRWTRVARRPGVPATSGRCSPR